MISIFDLLGRIGALPHEVERHCESRTQRGALGSNEIESQRNNVGDARGLSSTGSGYLDIFQTVIT